MTSHEHVIIANHPTGHPVMILGAGRGGTALLEMFLDDPLIWVVGICDNDPAAPGLRLAKRHGIATFKDVDSALRVSRAHDNCIVYNLTHDDAITCGEPPRNVISGIAAKLTWQMVTNLRQMKAELELSREQMAHLAHHDHLTGLPNRVMFLGGLQQCLAMAGRNDYRVAVLFLDLDGFKPINDTLGHAAGDILLSEVANRLRRCVRGQDFLARVGGDEFTLALSDCGAVENVALVARKIIASLAEPFHLAGATSQIGASIGIALYPDDSRDLETLLRQADAAMYRAKRGGKNGYCFYDAGH